MKMNQMKKALLLIGLIIPYLCVSQQNKRKLFIETGISFYDFYDNFPFMGKSGISFNHRSMKVEIPGDEDEMKNTVVIKTVTFQ